MCEIEERFGDCLDTDHSAGRGNGGGIREELAARELGRPPFGTVQARVWCSWRRRRAQISAIIAQHPDWEQTMRAIGLVLLGIAIMALLLTDADAQRRSSAQGSQAAGAKGSWCAVHPRHGGENCGYTTFDQCWATAGSEGGWCRPNPFSGTPYGTGYTWSGPKR